MPRADKYLLALGLTCLAASAFAAEFSAREAVTAVEGARVFHHPDASGRKNLAMSQGVIAAVWEDNRDGSPQAYVAPRPRGAAAFAPDQRISSGKEAYEPAIAALGDGVFAVAWEQDGEVWARAVATASAGPALRLGSKPGVQVSLAPVDARRVAAVFMEQRGKHRQVVVTTLTYDPETRGLKADAPVPVEAAVAAHDQLYPSIVVTSGGWCVAWEDRRHGHTRLLWSHAPDGRQFSAPQFLNDFHANRNQYDKGTGVTRVTLARFGERSVAAAWMDKRDGAKAYAIVGAVSEDGGKRFAKPQRIHDDFGDETVHYNPAIAGDASGRLAVVWDDLRNDNADLWYATWNGKTWSENQFVAPAKSPAEESNPALALDDTGRMHIIWVEKPAPGKPTRLWYSAGNGD